jgi:putative ABC transport system substrate-binding protein
LRDLGYVEGRNVTYEARFAEGRMERLSDLAVELVRAKVDVIVAQGGAAALAAKRVELLREALSKVGSIAVIWNANDEGMALRYRGIEQAARAFRVEVQSFGVREPDDFAGAFSMMTQRRPDAVFLVADVLTITHRKRVIEFAATHRIPTMYETSFHVRDGGLMSYGPSPEDAFRRAALYIDRIFKGAKPADLPAEQPTRYYLTINLKTATTMGLSMPPSLLLRVDDVIQ